MSAYHVHPGKRPSRVKPGWHKTARNTETARLQKIARHDRANAKFWS